MAKNQLPRRHWLRTTGAVLAATGLLGATSTPVAASTPRRLGAAKGLHLVQRLQPQSRVHGFKSASAKLAQSDPALLRATSSTATNVMVKLDYDAFSSYRGNLRGLAATSPSVTGKRLGADRASEANYRNYAANVEVTFASALAKIVPTATITRSLRTVYGGVALRVPANLAKTLLRLPGVVAVQSDAVNQPLTDASASFIGANTIYEQVSGNKHTGNGLIVGVIDTGLWPEHPSFADDGSYPAPRPRADGQPRVCNYGDNPLTPAIDPFQCNNKVIGGDIFYSPVAELYPTTARDSDGHGTHTTSTSAGGRVEHVNLNGINVGTIHGIAPGAAVIMYKVCGPSGCASSATTAAVGAAIDDGVDAINFSISGGTAPFQDPTELAFLDAYAANVFVSASAGNEGPSAGTANHLSPWVTTVAASTQSRAFQGTANLSSTDGATLAGAGASVMGGLATAAPVVIAGSVAGYDGTDTCLTPAAPGTFTGQVVVCQRGGNARVAKGYNVLQGGAVAMILYNPYVGDTETDNHWLPAVHLDGPQGQAVLDFLAAHSGVTATLSAGQKIQTGGDVMAAFSSRGPAGAFVKPDVTAPGVQILAGDTPTPEAGDVTLGPAGSYFQAIAGTSMSSPHVAGAGALLRALHPDWSAGDIKSALMTSAKQSVTKEDGVTAADPYDFGSGRIDLTKAGDPGLTISDTAANMYALGNDPKLTIDVNIASIDAPVMPGEVRTTRTVHNVSGARSTYDISTTAPSGGTIRVTPASISVAAGGTATFAISINGVALVDGAYFGEVRLIQRGGNHRLHLPVAFNKTQSSVSLSNSCEKHTVVVGKSVTCTVTATNNSLAPAHVDVSTKATGAGVVTQATGASVNGGVASTSADLSGKAPGSPAIGPAGFAGYTPLASFGITPNPIGDEEIINYAGVGNMLYAGDSYTDIGIVSNGYAVVGGGTISDVSFAPQVLPDPAVPNNVLAPFWSDLDGTASPGIYSAVLGDGAGNNWAVFEWQVQVCCSSDTTVRVFQLWIGLNGVEDITYSYDPTNLPANTPAGYGLTVGAENLDGSAGAMITDATPIQDYVVTSSGGAPGGSVSYNVNVKGTAVGPATVTSRLRSPQVRGTTTATDVIDVSQASKPSGA